MFTPLQKIIPKAITKLGIKREVEAALICEKYRKLAPCFLHEHALDHTRPKYFQRKILTVGVENSGWAYQVITKKELLMKAINEAVGQGMVKDIKTKIVGPMYTQALEKLDR